MFKLFSKQVNTVFLPECTLLDSIKSIPKYQSKNVDKHLLRAEANINYYQTNKFWKKDPGYKFVEKNLFPLLSKHLRLLDIGCSVGPLPEFLKRSGLWEKLDYYGIDINDCAVKLAKETYPEGVFAVSDLQNRNELTSFSVDIAYEKGMLISSYYPYKVLEKILALGSEYIFLIHCPLSTKIIESESRYLTALNLSTQSMYLISIMDRQKLLDIVRQYGYKIAQWNTRRGKIMIANYGSYKLHDLLIRKN